MGHGGARTASEPQYDAEVAYAVRLAGTVLSVLITHHPSLIPQAREPWYQANDNDVHR